MKCTEVIVEDLPVNIVESERLKKTIRVDVLWGKVVVRIPRGYPKNKAIERVCRKLPWIRKRLTYEREILSQAVKMSKNIFLFERIVQKLPSKREIKMLLYDVSSKILKELQVRYPETKFSKLRVAEMETRWSSYSKKGTISLDIRAASLPIKSLKYLLLHELLHSIEPSHNGKFKVLLLNHFRDEELREIHRVLDIFWYYTRINKMWAERIRNHK